jgi:hypothetical protein
LPWRCSGVAQRLFTRWWLGSKWIECWRLLFIGAEERG